MNRTTSNHHNEKEETKTKEQVLTYLLEISQSLFYFVKDQDNDTHDPNHNHDDGDNMIRNPSCTAATTPSLSDVMDQITIRLLEAGDPLKLSRPIPPSLSPPILYDSKGRVKPPRIVTKVDVLRNILLSMAPIALDIAARMSMYVVRNIHNVMVKKREDKEEENEDMNDDQEKEKENDEDEQDVMTRVFCIFSFWLPIAPQITQIVVDLFQYSSQVHLLSLESQRVFNHPLNGKYIQSFIRHHDATANCYNSNFSHDYENDTLGALQVWTQAVHCLLEYFAKHGDVKILQDCWNWTNLFCILGFTRDVDSLLSNRDREQDDVMESEQDELINNSPNSWAPETPYSPIEAIRWFAARAVADLLNLTPTSKGVFLKRIGLDEEMVPWVRHPWILLEEETNWQDRLLLEGVAVLVRCGEECKVKVPTAWEIRKVGISLPETLVHLGQGIVMPRLQTAVLQSQDAWHAIKGNKNNEMDENDICMDDDNRRGHHRQGLVMTETTCRNLVLLGTALCTDPYPPPILVCGPRGSGKSSLIRELAKLCNVSSHGAHGSEGNGADNLLELHVDEETDSKTLLGSYAATDIPGEFTWRAGALTNAVRSGKWVLLEDVESCPAEIQAALVKLFEERVLPLGVGKNEKCHPNFRLFGTCTISSSSGKQVKNQSRRRLRNSLASVGSGGKKLLHPGLWRKVHVEPLPYSELQVVSKEMFPKLPRVVSDAALNVFRQLDISGRLQDDDIPDTDVDTVHQSTVLNGQPILGNGRTCSVRDLMKLLARISSTVHFEPGAKFCTESQRVLCMAECYDIFAGWCPCRNLRRDFTTRVLASTWGITVTVAARYIETRQPHITYTSEYVEVGRATIARPPSCAMETYKSRENSSFAETNYALRLMESAGVCIAQNEPTLLVGETGCGKTTLIQRLASLSGHELIVQNLSLQTDSTDLLGGYRPLEIRHIARNVYTDFVRLFCSNFSKSQNAQFLDYVTTAYEKGQWKKLSQCFKRAAKMGVDKMRQLNVKNKTSPLMIEKWNEFQKSSERFEKQRVACDTGLAFVFTEGALVDAIRTGKWILLDEINLASSETLERLCGLLDDAKSSVTLTEKGDSDALLRHPDFRIFAAMNPATDTGKKDLPSSLRSRFTEIYVDELVDAVELRSVAVQYLRGTIEQTQTPLEHSETVVTAVEVYLKCRNLAEKSLVDVGGQRPRYTLRTMCRALTAARNLIIQQKFRIKRALLEGYELGFEGVLDDSSSILLRELLNDTLGHNLSSKELDHPCPRPRGGSNKSDEFVLMKPFWLKAGPNDQIDWSDICLASNIPKFILTKSTILNLRRLCRAISAGPYPVLLEGPTSAGKTTMVEYLAARLGHRCVRINNHEHTDVQEYTGTYASDSNGKLCFQEGILVQALRRGHWVILDELNLAPSEVLEALNRLLDDNRELYLPEINEVVKPHPNFRLFATQNPSGAYGGRKPLSRAFRNRFVEIHVGDIPEKEMVTILELRCKCPPSHAKLLVNVMSLLRKRRSKSGVFRGKDGLITPRDLLRWAERRAGSKHELAINGYMLLAERLRDEEEKVLVREIIEEQFKVEINCDELYHGRESESRRKLEMLSRLESKAQASGLTLAAIAPTKSLLRLLTLVEKCVEHKEPILLVGETGCGKTTVVQLMSILLDRDLKIVNCHASTETSDLLGGLRPLRGRKILLDKIVTKMRETLSQISTSDIFRTIALPTYLLTDDINIPEDAWSSIHNLVQQLRYAVSSQESTKSHETDSAKKRKLDNGSSEDVVAFMCSNDALLHNLNEVDALLLKYNSLFEWVDGPLVRAMREGNLFLLDEMSLAEDAVLERLNSVLEPSRTLVLAEKGGDVSVEETADDSAHIKAHEDFRIFATMNPGGDFGKRELSPALRSRFTEIWVPSVTDRSDIDLVLGQTLNASLEDFGVKKYLTNVLDDVKLRMLNYVSWFNNEICLRPMSTMNDFALSLRDVLAWARFIVETSSKNEGLGIWCAFAHGASLMHLDGLGLGTGLHHKQALETKNSAKKYLVGQIPDEYQRIAGFEDECKIDICSDSFETDFGVHPFMIPKGPMDIPQNLGFNLNAPTTGLNLRRVLRAMQISKPILLEGSPGVGKTSLISALAAASGHNLVRINLSEQTDISDLMGSDLPMPENNDNDLNGIGGGSFKWCDGALLKAIKNGDWVLLDELNLASQSVLEGLNSCLDHRASVYIPELGQTFDCPQSFRIFAAQNPIAQGGGRKGLPKSFLNRFTKVYVEALTNKDLNDIVKAKFPNLPSDLVEKIILFNDSVHYDIEQGKYGQLGSPWEFNLRDVFRLCELINHHYKLSGKVEFAKFSNIVYLQRLRSSSDRSMVAKCYEKHFSDVISVNDDVCVEFKDHLVKIGCATLTRNITCSLLSSSSNLLGREPVKLRNLMSTLETVALCVEMRWPCLLVGSPASGKSSILKYLVESCNQFMVEIALTPSSDVNELIGSFEQIDATEVESKVMCSINDIFNQACLVLTANKVQTEILREMSLFYHDLIKDMKNMKKVTISPLVINDLNVIKLIEQFVSSAEKAEASSSVFKTLCEALILSVKKDILNFKSTKKVTHGMNTTYFRWFDGILVQALEKGYWLHLENVNFCPSSVLDRLNSLMEIGGNLVLTECGISDDSGDGSRTPRIVKPHPDFRLFLSMNPAFGEISRAMRNRCVELTILAPSTSTIGKLLPDQEVDNSLVTSAETLDALDCLWSAGFRSSALSISVIDMHRKEFEHDDSAVGESQPTRILGDLASLLMASLQRGRHSSNCLTYSQKVAYEIHANEFTEQDIYCYDSDNDHFQMVEKQNFRRVLGQPVAFSKIAEHARLLRSIHNDFEVLPLGVSIFNRICQGDNVKLAFDLFAHSLVRNDPRLPQVKSFLTAYFLRCLHSAHMYTRVSYFEGFTSKKKVLNQVAAMLVARQRTTVNPDLFRVAYIDRLAHIIDELQTYYETDNFDEGNVSVSSLSAIEVSYCIQYNKVDSSQISCPVMPMLYPFFLSVDYYLELISDTLPSTQTPGPLLGALASLLTSRDRLWKFLKASQVVLNSPFLGFDEAGFLVHWSWLNKRLNTIFRSSLNLQNAQASSIIRNLCLIIETIDNAIQCKSADFRMSNSFWKKSGHPLVPAKAEDSYSIYHLKTVASEFSLMNHEDFGYLRLVSGNMTDLTLDQLAHRYHFIFSYNHYQKTDLLNALCMGQWATTDEMNATTRIETKDYDIAKALKVTSDKLNSAAEDFKLKLHSCTIDATIKTIENELQADGITRFQQTCNEDSSSYIIQHMLSSFGRIQLTQLSEFICVKNEEWIVDTLSKILLENDVSAALSTLRDMVLPRMKAFISTVVHYTVWPVSDLRAYQSIAWAIESSTSDLESIRHLFKCCYSTLISVLHRHYWCNTFNDLNAINNSLAIRPFWTKLNDGVHLNQHDWDKGGMVIACLSGAPRMKQNVVTEYFFRLQCFTRISDSVSLSVPFLTLENHKIRWNQAKDIIRLIASTNNVISAKSSGLQTLRFLTENTIAGLKDFFESEDLFSNFCNACFKESIDLLPVLRQCKHHTFLKLADKVLVPFINVYRRLGSISSSEDIGVDLPLAEVYLGILRFHLLIPSSPLDPGKKPGAKVKQWDSYVQELGSKLLAIRMESGLIAGNFEPDTADAHDTVRTLHYCQRKRSAQERKRVERPFTLPPYFDLFKEVKHFADTVASVDNVLLLLNDVCIYQEDKDVSCTEKEVTWQSSAVAFSNKISDKYACYEDVTEPFLAALGMIQKGLRSLLNEKRKNSSSPTSALMRVQDQLLQYPNVEASSTCDPQFFSHLRVSFDNAATSLKESSALHKIGKNTHLSILMSNLANTCILRERKGIADIHFMRIISRIFEAFAEAWNSHNSIHNDGSDSDPNTAEFSDQFPDHASEFHRIFENVEATENGHDGRHNLMKSELEESNDFSISEDHVMFMCDIHREIFTEERESFNDGLRIKAFVSTYAAAAQLNNILLREFSIRSEAERLNAHCYALGINSRTDSGCCINFHSFMRPSIFNEVDFHKDPNSAEVAKAGIPLENLTIRISQLIRAFPGNSLLLSIGLVAESMRRLDIKKTSLGKMLTGLEVILRKAQEWEQHASKRVSLGEPLEKISRLVAQWRKLELQSWSSLLTVRDQKHILQAKKHWIRLYNILLSDTINPNKKDHLSTKMCFPSWILVGQAKKLKNLCTCSIERESKEFIQQILKVLDTFILTSGIGQFHERLDMVKSFSQHLRAECDVNDERSTHKHTKAVILDSFVGYYMKFSSVIEKVKLDLRKPLEKKLKDEVKLAKWDEQSYYALAESAEKSHRKLMMIVHDYEEVLDTPVLKILEDHFLHGIRSNSEVGPETTTQPTSEIPPTMSMLLDIIPDAKECPSELVMHDNLTSLRGQRRNWVSCLNNSDDFSKYVLGIPKYAKKMDNLFSVTARSFASLGSNILTDISSSIFERIDVLREKGTKSMKERALVDLFKVLKQQGYSSMKWNVPKEVQEMQEIFRIQNPSLECLKDQQCKTLSHAEAYFQRCNVELSRLRSEVHMIGSPYMGKREMDIMVGFSEHGLLLLCQQRVIITKAIEDIKNILGLLKVFDEVQDALPHDQMKLIQSIKNFDRQYSITLETFRQTFLMMKTISTLVEDNHGHLIDLVSIVDNCFTSLNDAYDPCIRKTLITKHSLMSVGKAKDAVRRSIDDMKLCTIRNEREMYFPQYIFHPCLDMLHRCLTEAQTCEHMQSCPEQELSSPFALPAFTKTLSDLVSSALTTAQTLQDGNIDFTADNNGDEVTVSHTLWDIHTKTLIEWDTLNIDRFASLLKDLIDGLTKETKIGGCCLGSICADACVLVLKVVDRCQQRLSHTLNFYRSAAKFEYIKLRLFRVLVAKGYCSDEVEDSSDANGGGGEGNMKFEDDVEGTGMGEGEGKNDVTDQIENEEQLLGLKGDEKNENKKEQNQLDENEAETGMEMENEFDGELFDVPDKKDVDNNNNDDEEEELDREMGDGRDPNEQVVDEKMWDDDEDEDGDQNGEEEKFEKDSKVSGEALKDEMRTKEDDEKESKDEGKTDVDEDNARDNKKDDESPQGQDNRDDLENDREDRLGDDPVNNDYEDNYEDKHEGIDVNNDDQGQNNMEDDEDVDLNDDMNLDNDENADDPCDTQDGSQPQEGQDTEDTEEEGGADNIEADVMNVDNDEETAEDSDGNEDNVENSHQTHGNDNQMNADGEENENDTEEDKPEEKEENIMNSSKERYQDAHGVAASTGSDSVQQEQDENQKDGEGDDNDEDQHDGEGEADDEMNNSGAGQNGTSSGDIQKGDQGAGNESNSASMDIPNPFRDPGDAEKFWHRKLNVIADATDENPEQDERADSAKNENDDTNAEGDFEFTSREEDMSTQVLGKVMEEETTTLNQEQEEESKSNQQEKKKNVIQDSERKEKKGQASKDEKSFTKNSIEIPEEEDQDHLSKEDDVDANDDDVDMDDASNSDQDRSADNDSTNLDTKVITDLDQLKVRETDQENDFNNQGSLLEEEINQGITQEELEEARRKWSNLQSETTSLSRRLCEKLRLVMEPLVASKLRGDYRTGKRINMKRVIGYIASGYRKDKIWLRRTKPGKRDYRVLLAVDNSESMKNGAGDMALTAMATLANGMSQLEIGELGIASFGEEMKLLHPFNAPFTSSSGVDLVSNFTFADKRTRTALCVESALAALEAQANSSSSMQLVFIISDGRIERDSRERLRRIVREMTEKNILLIMVVVEGDLNQGTRVKDSIVNMKEVSFENGKPKVKHFIDDYPFPYYMVLQDMHTLPEVLGDALKQWFEMMAHYQKP